MYQEQLTNLVSWLERTGLFVSSTKLQQTLFRPERFSVCLLDQQTGRYIDTYCKTVASSFSVMDPTSAGILLPGEGATFHEALVALMRRVAGRRICVSYTKQDEEFVADLREVPMDFEGAEELQSGLDYIGAYCANTLVDGDDEVEHCNVAIVQLNVNHARCLYVINNQDFCDDRLENEELFKIDEAEGRPILSIDGIKVVSAGDGIGYFIRKVDLTTFISNQPQTRPSPK